MTNVFVWKVKMFWFGLQRVLVELQNILVGITKCLGCNGKILGLYPLQSCPTSRRSPFARIAGFCDRAGVRTRRAGGLECQVRRRWASVNPCRGSCETIVPCLVNQILAVSGLNSRMRRPWRPSFSWRIFPLPSSTFRIIPDAAVFLATGERKPRRAFRWPGEDRRSRVAIDQPYFPPANTARKMVLLNLLEYPLRNVSARQ